MYIPEVREQASDETQERVSSFMIITGIYIYIYAFLIRVIFASVMIMPQGIESKLNIQDLTILFVFPLKINRNHWFHLSRATLNPDDPCRPNPRLYERIV